MALLKHIKQIKEVGKYKPKIILFLVFALKELMSLFPFMIHMFVLGSALNFLLQMIIAPVYNIYRQTPEAGQ